VTRKRQRLAEKNCSISICADTIGLTTGTWLIAALHMLSAGIYLKKLVKTRIRLNEAALKKREKKSDGRQKGGR